MQPRSSLFDNPRVEVRRSARRKRSVSAHLDGETVVVAIPASFTKAQEQEWVTKMLSRLEVRDRRRRPGDAALAARARHLAEQYLDGAAQADSVRWVTNQNTRWGSCTVADRSIRLSHRLVGMPQWVIDYVLLHELAHLLHPGHGQEFWACLTGYPQTERARGFLDGVAYGWHRVEPDHDADSADSSPSPKI